MPEEITQRLGFDASRAIEELRKLQNQLKQFKQGLQSTSGALRKFPSKAQPAIKAFRELATAANKAKIAVQSLSQAGAVPATVPASARTATQAMSNLGTQAQTAGQKMQTAVVGSFNQSAQAAHRLGRATSVAAATSQRAATTTAAAGAQTATALNKVGKAGKDAGKLVTISWQTVARVIQAQVIVRALSRLISLFGEAHQAAMEFTIAIGEVSTIAQDALGSLSQIGDSVLKLSSNLGIAASEVAEGLYQTLSNQVVEAGDALRFEEQAAKLSIATHSQLRESVNALSSVMNSYGLDVSEVGRVSDVLFKTIELGRLRMGEFGDVLGRVTPLTAALGIRYEEMAAAIAALTQKGVPAHTAITQLTQVSQKLLRPTKKLQELYREWGVETGPEAIRRFGGLAGVLLKMKDATAGNDKEFADLLGRVRAMVGALNLTSQEGNALTHALNEMEESAGAAEKAFERMTETAGYKAKKAWIDLENEVIKFGHTLLELSTPIAKTLKLLVENLDLIVAAATGAGIAFLAMSKAGGTAILSLAGLKIAVAGLYASFLALLPVIAVVAAAMAVAFAARKIAEGLRGNQQLFDEHKKQIEELTKTHEKATLRRIESTRKEFQEYNKIMGEGFSALSREYRKVRDIFEINSKAINDILQDSLSNLFAQRQKGIKEIKKAMSQTDSAIKDSAKEVTETQEKISEDAFKREIKRMSSRQQLWKKLDRVQRTAADARKAYTEAGASEEAAIAARKLSHLAEERAEDAVTHAEKMGHLGTIKRAEKALDKIRSDRIRGETTFQIEREEFRSKAHKAEMARLDEYEKKLKAIFELMTKLADPMISEGVRKGPEQVIEDFERLNELMPAVGKALDEALDVSLFERLDGAKSISQLRTGFVDAFEKAQVDWTNLSNQLETAIKTKVYPVAVRIEITNPNIMRDYEKRYGKYDPFADPGQWGDKMGQVLTGGVEKWENLQNIIDTRTVNSIKKLEHAAEKIVPDEFFSGWDRLSATWEEGTPKAEDLRKMIENLGGSLLKTAKQGEFLTKAQHEAYKETVDYAKELENAGELSQRNLDHATEAVKNITNSMKDLVAVEKAYKEQIKMGDGAYTDRLKTIAESRAAQKKVNEAQEKITQEANKTADELEGAKQKQIEIPAAAVKAKEALAQETNQARQLKTELQGAVQAQKDLAIAQIPPPAVPTEPVPLAKTKEELEAQTIAARQLTAELIKVDSQFTTVLESIEGVTQALAGTSEIAAEIAGSMDWAVFAAGDLQTEFDLITQQVGFSIDAVNSLTTHIDTAVLATNAASKAAAGWADQLGNCTSAGYSAASAMRAAASAANAAAAACRAASAACSGGSASAYHGGSATRYRHEGGFAPRGLDRIPIMASPGEFIVNARSSKRFFTELQAINAGRQPNYRDYGGLVTNIGDINVSVTPGASGELQFSTFGARQTARDIATALRRELRLGTSRLTKSVRS